MNRTSSKTFMIRDFVGGENEDEDL